MPASTARQRNAMVGPNIKCCHCSFLIFHGIHTSIDKEPYSFVFFQGGGGGGEGGPVPLSPPSASAHEGMFNEY